MTAKATIAAVGVSVSGVLAQAVLPDSSSSVERLGTAGLLVAAAFFLVRYFMGELAKKDAAIQKLADEHTKMLIVELRAGYQVKETLIVTLRDLTSAVREGTETRRRHE